MRKRILVVLAVTCLGMIAACAAKRLEPQGGTVQIVYEKPEGNCRRMYDVVGSQGNWFTGAHTSNKNLAEGAMNDLRNQAGAMGGTHVWIHQQAMNTSGYSTTNSLVMGTVYKCDK